MLVWFFIFLFLTIPPLSMYVKNPIIFSMIIIIYSIISGSLLLLTSPSWVIWSFLILFVGGMMVMFSYISSLVSTVKLFSSPPPLGPLGCFSLPLAFYASVSYSVENFSIKSFPIFTPFTPYGGEMLMLVTLIIIMTLLIVVNLLKTFSGAIKWKF